MNQIELCRLIADVAHAAKGQTRADGETPFIAHPADVAVRVEDFMARNPLRLDNREAIAAAWLHDTVEDTGIALPMLEAWGVDARTVHLVDLLTKKNAQNEPEEEAYFRAIAQDPTAMVIKAADRISNLTDAAGEVRRGHVKRWANYAKSTRAVMLPFYVDHPLRGEIEKAVKAVEDAIIEARGGCANGDFQCGDFEHGK